MTRLGLGSYGVAWSIGVSGYPAPTTSMDGIAFLRFANSLGLGVVQIADNLPLHTLSPDEQSALLAEAKRLNIAVEVGTRGIQPEHIRDYIKMAQTFESPILRVVVDTAEDHPAPGEVIEAVQMVLQDLTAAGITLAIENHDRFKAQTLAGIIRTINHPNVGICLDTVNSFGALEGPEIVVNTLARFVVNLHVKEFFIRRADHNMGFVITGAPAGAGMLNISWLLETLWAYGRDFNAIIEHWPAPEASTDATATKEQLWARQSVDYLRTLIPT